MNSKLIIRQLVAYTNPTAFKGVNYNGEYAKNLPFFNGLQHKSALMRRLRLNLDIDRQFKPDPISPDSLLSGYFSEKSGEKIARKSPLDVSYIYPLHANLVDNVADKYFGLFRKTITIDLSRLFTVNNDSYISNVEINTEIADNLRVNGWIEKESRLFGNVFIAPQDFRIKVIEALANAIVENNYGNHQTVAFAISEKPHFASNAIRAEEDEDGKVKIILDGSNPECELFIINEALANSGLITPKHCSTLSNKISLGNACNRITQIMKDYEYDNI